MHDVWYQTDDCTGIFLGIPLAVKILFRTETEIVSVVYSDYFITGFLI